WTAWRTVRPSHSLIGGRKIGRFAVGKVANGEQVGRRPPEHVAHPACLLLSHRIWEIVGMDEGSRQTMTQQRDTVGATPTTQPQPDVAPAALPSPVKAPATESGGGNATPLPRDAGTSPASQRPEAPEIGPNTLPTSSGDDPGAGQPTSAR